MTPKEKAIYLVNKFSSVGLQQRNEGIACALIAVDEMIEEAYFTDGYYNRQEYWQQVKVEIENL